MITQKKLHLDRPADVAAVRAEEQPRLRLVSSLEAVEVLADAKRVDEPFFSEELEAMFKGDAWDLRKVPFTRAVAERSLNWLRFQNIPEPLRPLVRRFARAMVRHCSPNLLCSRIRFLRFGLGVLHSRHPEATDLSSLTRSDVEAVLEQASTVPLVRGGMPKWSTVSQRVLNLKSLVIYVEQTAGETPPPMPASELFKGLNFGEYITSFHIQKELPEDVRTQVETHLGAMMPLTPRPIGAAKPTLMPLVALISLTGWHASDVLNLRIDNCLERADDGGWWLCGARAISGLQERVALPNEIAGLVEAERRRMYLEHGYAYNPQRLLFGAYDSRGRITNRLCANVETQLRSFVRYNDIRNCDGKRSVLTTHNLRHTHLTDACCALLAARGYKSPENLPQEARLLPVPRLDDNNGRENDMERVFESDIWDARRIEFLHKQVTKSVYYLRFTLIPLPFRPLVKRFIRTMLSKWSMGSCDAHMRSLHEFLEFYHAQHPLEVSLAGLTRRDIEAFLVYVRSKPLLRGSKDHSGKLSKCLGHLKNLLRYVARVGEAAPTKSVDQLIWPEDAPRRQWRVETNDITDIKHIPPFVLEQMDAHMHTLPSWLFPIVTLLRVSGWRLGDILSLRLDNCLERTQSPYGESGWWLVGDIPKVKLKNHRIPIRDEIAALVQALRESVKEKCGDDYNPSDLLFPSRDNRRYGMPHSIWPIQRALKKFIEENDIRDESGRLFPLTTKHFRHTLAVEMINDDVPLPIIQKWMAHKSPEMTMHYARILSTTMQRKTIETLARGVLRNQPDGNPKIVEPSQEADAGLIEWEYIRHNLEAIRLANGYCFRAKKDPCPVQIIPCHGCSSFATTPEFLPQFESQRKDILIQIEMGKTQNRPNWVERNQQLLAPVERIIETLSEGTLHHTAGKSIREYTSKEREQRVRKEDKGNE